MATAKRMTARGVLVPVVVVMALSVGAAASAAATPARSIGRASAIPATPILLTPLYEGVNTKPNLSAAQRTKVAADVRWLHQRLNILLPRILWTDPALRTDGTFDAPTGAAVAFFKAWANRSRALLHQSQLFAKVDGVAGTSTVAVVAIVAAYFQRHPPVAYANLATAAQLQAHNITAGDLAPLSKVDMFFPDGVSWKLLATESSEGDSTPITGECTPKAPPAKVFVRRQYGLTDDTGGSYGNVFGDAFHFGSAAEAQKFVTAHQGAAFLKCNSDSWTTSFEKLVGGGSVVGTAAQSSLPAVGSGVAYRYQATIQSDHASVGSCTFFIDSYWVPLGTTVFAVHFETCHQPWDQRVEPPILQHKADQLVLHG